MAPLTAAAASAEVMRMAQWIMASGDSGGKSFIIVDKSNARVFGFAGDGGLRGTAPALLGLARGDVDPPGIGDRPLSAIGPQDRITAAGRYVAVLGNDLGKADILWRHNGGAVAGWLMNGGTIAGYPNYGPVGNDWNIAGASPGK